VISEARLVELMSTAPARILGVAGGSLGIGDAADITVIDPEQKFHFTEEGIVSRSKNTPFLGWQFQGKAVLTLLGGRITHIDLPG
jgi:dihydroorotase